MKGQILYLNLNLIYLPFCSSQGKYIALSSMIYGIKNMIKNCPCMMMRIKVPDVDYISYCSFLDF